MNIFCHRDLEDSNGVLEPVTNPAPELALISAKDGAVHLYWQINPDYRANYMVYISNKNDESSFRKIAETTNNFYIIKNLSYDSTYYFAIKIKIDGNESSFSNIISAMPINFSAPLTPSYVLVQGTNYEGKKSMYISWVKNTEGDFLKYNIYRFDGESESEYVKIAETYNNYYSDSANMALNLTIRYRISAVDKGGLVSPLSLPESDIILDTVTTLQPEDNSTVADRIVFKWNAVNSAAGYKVVLLGSKYGTELWQKTVYSSSANVYEIVYDGDQLSYHKNYYWKVCTFTKDYSNLNSYSPIKSFYFTYSE